jgi:hypothetical protein
VSVDVLNECGYAVDELELVACARHVMDRMKVHPDADLAISLVDEAAMTVLHEKWMDLPGPTDVMSFPMDELRPGRDGVDLQEGVLGDIVLCPAVAEEQARQGRARSGRGAAPADDPWSPAPVGLRSRRPRREARDVRAAAAVAPDLSRRPRPTMIGVGER